MTNFRTGFTQTQQVVVTNMGLGWKYTLQRWSKKKRKKRKDNTY